MVYIHMSAFKSHIIVNERDCTEEETTIEKCKENKDLILISQSKTYIQNINTYPVYIQNVKI